MDSGSQHTENDEKQKLIQELKGSFRSLSIKEIYPKGTVSVIWSNPPKKKSHSRFTRIPLKPLSDQ